MAKEDIIKMAMKGSSSPANFGGKLMQILSESNIQTHVWHLQTKSYAQHMALGGFYDCIVGFTDSLLEIYQGHHGVKISGNIDIKIDSKYATAKPLAYMKKLKSNLDTLYNNKHLNENCLLAVMDEIMGLVDKTIYLLSLS